MDSFIGGFVAVFFLGAIALGFWLMPKYNVYSSTLNGKAQLQEAEYTRQIAELDADAEAVRARGVAEADSIISGGLRGEVEYLQYLWIQALKEGNCSAIYIPNDGSLPLMKRVEQP